MIRSRKSLSMIKSGVVTEARSAGSGLLMASASFLYRPSIVLRVEISAGLSWTAFLAWRAVDTLMIGVVAARITSESARAAPARVLSPASRLRANRRLIRDHLVVPSRHNSGWDLNLWLARSQRHPGKMPACAQVRELSHYSSLASTGMA